MNEKIPTINGFDMQFLIMKDNKLLNEWQNINFDSPLTERNINLANQFKAKHKDRIINISNNI